jgi:hypothetical protein
MHAPVSCFIACALVALASSETADVNAEPVGVHIGRGTTKNVDSIIPEFQTGKAWAKSNAALKAGYNEANAAFKKLNAKAFKAQGARVKELNAKAEKAHMKLKEAKERIQKKYAEDDPQDFGKGPETSADKANKALAAKAKDTNWGSYGASGTPGKKKFYTDGAISSNAYRDPEGHYLLGASRRRIGAGFGRRRRFGTPSADVKLTKKGVETAEKGHDLLKAMGKPETDHNKEEDSILKTKKHKKTEIAAAPEKEQLPAGVKVADKKFLTKSDEAALKATGAGTDAQVDSTAHFETPTEERILGKTAGDAITGATAGSKAEAEEMSDEEVIELLQEPFN